MLKSKIKIILFTVILSFLFMICNTGILAASGNKKVILGGDTIGLKIDTGVMIAGKYSVQTANQKVSPWKNSDIEEGDKIIAYNDHKVSTNSELLHYLKIDSNNSVNLTIQRNNKQHTTKVDIVNTINNDKSLGLYIKDRILGIGTLTFIDQQTSHFASLGHGIYDDNISFGNIDGTINSSKIEGIKKSYPGEAGEKRAILTNKSFGIMVLNKKTGIYGKVTNRSMSNHQTIEVGKQEDVVMGPAQIYTVIQGEKIEAFNIKITGISVQESPNIKGLKYEVVDASLLEKTGGIVQGMSGSPIVQNNKLIGAVSHVSIENPKVGYGIHLEWMLEDCNSF